MAKRKGKAAKAPFVGYVAYEVFHKNEGRWYVCLVSPFNGKDRHTTSRARYRMAVKLGRKLLKQEQVDHINEDKTDDRVSNLQILSVAENNRKHIIASGKQSKLAQLSCAWCDKAFTMKEAKYRAKAKAGQTLFYCSRSCGARREITHGTCVGYQRGCRCVECRAAATVQRRRYLDRGKPRK
jgi:hypothetical protein